MRIKLNLRQQTALELALSMDRIIAQYVKRGILAELGLTVVKHFYSFEKIEECVWEATIEPFLDEHSEIRVS